MRRVSDVEFIRSCAARGLSKSHTAQLLGFWPSVFPDYLVLLGLDDVEWVKGAESLLAKQARRESGLARKGRTQDYLTEMDRARIRKRNNDLAPKHSAFGVVGTLSELVALFGVVTKVSVGRRIKLGMSVEDALTTPYSRTTPPRPTTDHIWKKYSEMSFRNYEGRRLEPRQSL